MNVLGRTITAQGRQPAAARLEIRFPSISSWCSRRIRSAARRTHISPRCGCRRRQRAGHGTRRALRGDQGFSGRHYDQRSRRNRLGQRGRRRAGARSARGGIAGARRLDAGARRSACRGPPAAAAGCGGAEDARARRVRVLLSAFSIEYGLLGIATAFFALVAGSAAAWYVVSRIMELQFTVYPSVAADSGAATALAVTLGLGLAGTWRILSVKPAALLKNL